MNRLQSWVDQGVISAVAAEKLGKFAALIHAWNPKINLTGFKSLEEIEEVLIGECVAAFSRIGRAAGSVVDFGSGAGIPGLVWLICDPLIRLTSVEVRQKKIAFQKAVRRELCLEAEILSGHFPEVVYGRSFDVITSRATRLEDRVWKEAGGMLNAGGRLVRFGRPGAAVPTGWRGVVVSSRTELLIQP